MRSSPNSHWRTALCRGVLWQSSKLREAATAAASDRRRAVALQPRRRTLGLLHVLGRVAEVLNSIGVAQSRAPEPRGEFEGEAPPAPSLRGWRRPRRHIRQHECGRGCGSRAIQLVARGGNCLPRTGVCSCGPTWRSQQEGRHEVRGHEIDRILIRSTLRTTAPRRGRLFGRANTGG